MKKIMVLLMGLFLFSCGGSNVNVDDITSQEKDFVYSKMQDVYFWNNQTSQINVNDYLLSKLEADINEKVNELVNVLVYSKYGSMTFYYDCLFKQVINEYIDNDIIDLDKIELCIEIMDNYYDGVIGIKNIFNI